MSNIATLTRLGLFCETMRLFLRAPCAGSTQSFALGFRRAS